MKIYLPCWGKKHIDLLDRCLGESLRWPENNRSVAGAQWMVTTDTQESLRKINDIIESIDHTAKVRPFVEPKVVMNTGDVLLVSLQRTINQCLKDNEPLLMATPDYIYSEGSIETIKQLGAEKGSVVSMAHMRVLPAALETLCGIPMNGHELTRLGMLYQHSTWEDSEESANPGRTYFGGISWRYLNEERTTLGVRHRLPAPFYANFLEEDLSFFSKQYRPPFDLLTFALWDHLFPSHCLEAGRLRYIGASDAAAMIEVTDRDANVPPINPYGKTNKDEYVNSNFQNHICKQFISIFRC